LVKKIVLVETLEQLIAVIRTRYPTFNRSLRTLYAYRRKWPLNLPCSEPIAVAWFEQVLKLIAAEKARNRSGTPGLRDWSI